MSSDTPQKILQLLRPLLLARRAMLATKIDARATIQYAIYMYMCIYIYMYLQEDHCGCLGCCRRSRTCLRASKRGRRAEASSLLQVRRHPFDEVHDPLAVKPEVSR